MRAARTDAQSTSAHGHETYRTRCTGASDGAQGGVGTLVQVVLLEGQVTCDADDGSTSAFRARGVWFGAPIVEFGQASVWRDHAAAPNGAWTVDTSITIAAASTQAAGAVMVSDVRVGAQRVCWTWDSATATVETRDPLVCDAAMLAGDAATSPLLQASEAPRG